MAERYPFKRNAFYELVELLKTSKVIFLTGPRKSGKTVCLKQLEDGDSEHYQYIDFKRMNSLAQKELIDRLCHSMETDIATVYLLDEFTYLFQPDIILEVIADSFNDNPQTKIKVVISGSQSYALSYWAKSSFCGNARFLNIDFLTFNEWVRFNGKDKPSEDLFTSFCQNMRSFYKDFTSVPGYIESTLHETVISNTNAANLILKNDVDTLSADSILDILYASLFSGHNHPSYQSFFDKTRFHKLLIHYFKEEYKISGDDVLKRIEQILSERYRNYQSMGVHEYEQGLLLLLHSGLITLTYECDKKLDRDIFQDLIHGRFREAITTLEGSDKQVTKDMINRYVNISIRYPMFYLDLVEYALGRKPENLPHELLGSMFECYTRGYLPKSHNIIYRDMNNNEVDYVNFSKEFAIELTIADKAANIVHFSALSSIDDLANYKFLLTTRSRMQYNDESNIVWIQFYEFIYRLTKGESVDHIYDEAIKSIKRHSELPTASIPYADNESNTGCVDENPDELTEQACTTHTGCDKMNI
ncbi:MAG: AAA family ATPase [Eubacterium sp.]|nr:AAA family ATPase [Eubacterium sp.]